MTEKIIFDEEKIFVDVPLEEFCKTWDLEPYYGRCADCSASMFVNNPFVCDIDGELVAGLTATKCKCGSPHTPFSQVLSGPIVDILWRTVDKLLE